VEINSETNHFSYPWTIFYNSDGMLQKQSLVTAIIVRNKYHQIYGVSHLFIHSTQLELVTISQQHIFKIILAGYREIPEAEASRSGKSSRGPPCCTGHSEP
jgi:hypothetical protein